MRNQPQSIGFTGVVTDGIGESSRFTGIPWVRRQFIEKLRIDPYPGTLNLTVRDAGSLAVISRLRKLNGIPIVPEDPAYCPAKSFIVKLGGRVDGAIVFPEVPGYPDDKVEIISSRNIREALSLHIGTSIRIEVLETHSG